jgi:NurA-like 5'-3' nuclease
MKPESRKRLEDFVERAELIQTYSYFENSENIVGFQIKKVGDKWAVDFHQPAREQTDALLFNVRLFYGGKDDISIRRMAELCDDPDISDNWKSEFEAIRKNLNERFDMVTIESPEGTITYRDIFEMFLYGSLGHRTEKDKAYKIYQKNVTSKTARAIMYNTFHETIIFLSTAVINIGKASKDELQRENTTFYKKAGYR